MTGSVLGLDMITQLLTPKGDTELKNKIEEVGGDEEVVEEEGEIDWYYEQTPHQERNHDIWYKQITNFL